MRIEDVKLNQKLTSGSRSELSRITVEPNEENESPTIVQMRDEMGWLAKNITTNELVIKDKVLKGHIPVRLYRKKTLVNEVIPVLVYYHGGGFFGGSIQNVEQICRTFADRSDMAVVSVGYLLSPEHPFPAGLMDCFEVVETIATEGQIFNVLGDQIFVAGDSAGGNLAITTSILDSSVFGTNYIKKIISYYPVVDLTSKGKGKFWEVSSIQAKDDDETKMIRDYIIGFSKLESQVEDWYCGSKIDRSNSLISPFYAAAEELAKLPPIKIIIGEYDPLRLQVEAFVNELSKAETNGSLSIYSGMIHAFMDKIGVYDEAEKGVVEALDFIKEGE